MEQGPGMMMNERPDNEEVRICVTACILLVCLLCNFRSFNNCSVSFKICNMCYCVL